MSKVNLNILVAVCVLIMALVVPAGAVTHYVDPNGSAEFTTIQAAIVASSLSGDEIEVAPGTYNEAIDFLGKAIKLYSSDGPEVTTIDGTGHYHVVQCVSSEDANTVLEGFTITGGYASDSSYFDNCGGGMYCESSSPTVTNCTFSGNSADSWGGAMFNSDSSPTVTDCTFIGNTADYQGGGIYNYWSSNPTVTDCTFSGNSADSSGGGMYNADSSPTVTNCTFIRNTANTSGGGMYNDSGGAPAEPTVINCTFSQNIANNGGGMYNYYRYGSPKVKNCTFSSNYANNGGGMYNNDNSLTVTNCTFSDNMVLGGGGGMFNCTSSWSCDPTVTNCTFSGNMALGGGGGIDNTNYSNCTVTNCILWGDEPNEILDDASSSSTVTYSDVEGGWEGTGGNNIDADPLFVTGHLGGYYLSQVAAGQAANSPCVDAGSDTAANLGMDESTTRTDQVEDVGTVDMGYHYRLPEPGDFNGDWKVNFIDFAVLAEQWQQAPGVPSADIVPPEGDGIVDELDLRLLVENWLGGAE